MKGALEVLSGRKRMLDQLVERTPDSILTGEVHGCGYRRRETFILVEHRVFSVVEELACDASKARTYGVGDMED